MSMIRFTSVCPCNHGIGHAFYRERVLEKSEGMHLQLKQVPSLHSFNLSVFTHVRHAIPIYFFLVALSSAASSDNVVIGEQKGGNKEARMWK